MKLSIPQYRLLVSILHENRRVAEYYPPAKKLVELGLAIWKPTKFGNKLEITHAGKQRI